MPQKKPIRQRSVDSVKAKPKAGLLDVAAQQRAEKNAREAQEQALLGSTNWQWRKFALGLMNGLNNYKAYAEAYSMPNVDRDDRAYQVAAAAASRLLKNVKFREYWRELIVEQGFNHDVVDTEALKLITNEDTPPQVRRAAIRDYNELTGRIVKKQALTDGDGKSLFDEGGGFELVVRRPGK